MNDIRRPLSLNLKSTTSDQAFSATKNTKLGSAPRPAKPMTKSSSVTSTGTYSSTSSSVSTSSSGLESPDSPSLILPYLYVGDQAQTQIDTISNLNISYILSLQSLPKFLDVNSSRSDATDDKKARKVSNSKGRDGELVLNSSRGESSMERDNSDLSACRNLRQQKSKAIIKNVNGDEVEIQTQLDYHDSDQTRSERDGASANGSKGAPETPDDDAIAKELLPSMNSSKDYLVKFKSCVNRLIKGKCINISDTFEQLVDKFFDETHSFIEEARKNKCNILVHCKAGISRSPTIAIAYLMKWKRLHLQEAYEFVKQCRPQISPNLNFMGQLMNYERQLLQRGSHLSKRGISSSILPSPLSCYLPGPHLNEEQSDPRADPSATLTRETKSISCEQPDTTKTNEDLMVRDKKSDGGGRTKENLIIRVTA